MISLTAITRVGQVVPAVRAHLLHPGKRAAVAMLLVLMGLLGLLGVSWEVIARIHLHTGGVRVSGRITGSYSYNETVGFGLHRTTITHYFLTFSYGTYNSNWEAPDQSWLERMPAGTQITVSYPPDAPNLGQPVGDPFNSDNPLLVGLDALLQILVEGFLPLLLLLAGIALLRGFWRGRTVLGQDYRADSDLSQ